MAEARAPVQTASMQLTDKSGLQGRGNSSLSSARHHGSFARTFSLPKGIDVDNIEASFSKGVLEISLPKRPEAVKPEKIIPVKSRSAP
ncbi:MAG: hypothetical protein CVV08_01935 [Gammaproteobacteria bacterium HGW-Gammaproteobacteria-12]|nr:MAG: hypothetical protein CVV08_01935 [Gammaproteobacteria bacterium HGW-Gammaproteobacteria-12]